MEVYDSGMILHKVHEKTPKLFNIIPGLKKNRKHPLFVSISEWVSESELLRP